MAAQLEEGCYENYTILSHIFQFENGLSNDDVRGRGSPYFVRYGRELVPNPAISLKKAGDAFAERP